MKIIHCADLHLDSKMTANLSKEQAKERKRQNQIKKVEKRIQEIENRIEELDNLLNDEAVATDVKRLIEINSEHEALDEELLELMTEWEELYS